MTNNELIKFILTLPFAIIGLGVACKWAYKLFMFGFHDKPSNSDDDQTI